MEEENFKVRQMIPEDFKIAAYLANQESWNESEKDKLPFFAIDPNGFFVGELNGEGISTACGVKYNTYAHIGLYLVKKECRGKGYGLKVFEQVMEHVKDAQVIGLDAAEAQVKNYEKWGFKIFDKGLGFQRKAEGTSVSKSIIELRSFDFEQLVEYDEKGFGDCRRNFLKALLNQEGYYSLGFVENGTLKGYGFLRKSQVGYKVGPFVAEDKPIAQEILNGLQNLVKGEELFLDTFENNKPMTEIMKEQNWTQRMYFFRMYSKGIAKLDVNKAYAVVLEVG